MHDNEPLLRTLQGRMGDKSVGNEAFVTDHSGAIKQKLLDDLCKLEHLPHKLVKGEAGLQTAWGLLRRTVPSRFLHVPRGHAVDVTAEFCDEIEDTVRRILAQWTDQGGLTAGQQRIVELPIELGGLGFLPVKDLAAIVRLSALASLPENSGTHSFREAVINKEGLDLEARLQSKMETPPKDIVGNVHVLPAGRSAKAISRHPPNPAKSFKDAWMYADHFVPQPKHCWLRQTYPQSGTRSTRHGSLALRSSHSSIHQSGEWTIQMGVTAPFWACVTRCRASLWQAAPWCKALLDAIGRHVAWCARRAREIRHNRLRGFLVEYVKTTGAIATSEQAMHAAVHTADIHISEPNIWVDVRVECAQGVGRMEQEKRREYGQGPPNPSTLFDGVVPAVFKQHGCPSQRAVIFLHHILRRRVAKL